MDTGRLCFSVIFLIITHLSADGATIKKQRENVICDDLPEMILIDILGAAYNSRYMSIKPPIEETVPTVTSQNGKRRVNVLPSFYVDKDYAEVIAEEPAWIVNHVDVDLFAPPSLAETTRERRSVTGTGRQWECQSNIVWKDLGPDYFPRYLRTVECAEKVCWYGHFMCKPRSFTVKLLRRRRNRCIVAKPNTEIGTSGLPKDLKQLWVWEEHAVNFCCDCST